MNPRHLAVPALDLKLHRLLALAAADYEDACHRRVGVEAARRRLFDALRPIDPRPRGDLTAGVCDVIDDLRNQVAQLEAENAEMADEIGAYREVCGERRDGVRLTPAEIKEAHGNG